MESLEMAAAVRDSAKYQKDQVPMAGLIKKLTGAGVRYGFDKAMSWWNKGIPNNALTINRSESDQEFSAQSPGDRPSLNSSTQAEIIPTAYSAVNMIAQAFAPLPKYVVELKSIKDDYFEPMEDHLLNITLRHPCPYIDTYLFWGSIATELACSGNAYLLQLKTKQGLTRFMLPGWVQPYARIAGLSSRDQGYRSPGYGQASFLGQQVTLPTVTQGFQSEVYTFIPWPLAQDLVGRIFFVQRSDIIEFHGPGFDGVESPSPIQKIGLPIIQAMNAGLGYQREKFESGVNAQTVIQTDPSLEGVDWEKLKEWGEQLEKDYGGVRSAGKTPVLPPGYELKNIGTISAVDLQLVELLKWGVEDLARVWNYNPYLLGVLTSGTVPKMQEQIEHFSRFTFQPWVDIIQSGLSFRLMTPTDKALGREIRADSSMVRRGTWLDQVNALDLAVTRGAFLTPNEGRRRIGQPPLPKPDPDANPNDQLRSPKGSPDMRANPAGGGEKSSDEREVDNLIDSVPHREYNPRQ